MKTLYRIPVAALLIFAIAHPAFAMISVGILSKEKAGEMGITMKSRNNGDAGVMVWLEFEKGGFVDSLSYTELRMEDRDGNHLVSARLRTHPVVHDQPEDVVTVAFSADPAELKNCSFFVVSYGGPRSRGGAGYYLKVKEFLDLEEVAKAYEKSRSGRP